MARKTSTARHNDKLIAATAEAARILAGDLAFISALMQDYLRTAQQTKDYEDASVWLGIGLNSLRAEVELAGTFGKVKGERRYQHLNVEKAPNRTEIAPKSARNSPPSVTQTTAENASLPNEMAETEAGIATLS